MDLSKLGYSSKWLKYGLLTKEKLDKQLEDFAKADVLNTEHYRYHSFNEWLNSKSKLSDEEVAAYLELAKEDEEPIMAGNALGILFSSTILSRKQFDYIKSRLPEFGTWTKKLILRVTLQKRVESEDITEDLYKECLDYKKKFKDNRLLISIINVTDNQEILEQFKTNGSGKQIRTLAEKKLKKIQKKEGN